MGMVLGRSPLIRSQPCQEFPQATMLLDDLLAALRVFVSFRQWIHTDRSSQRSALLLLSLVRRSECRKTTQDHQDEAPYDRSLTSTPRARGRNLHKHKYTPVPDHGRQPELSADQ